MRHGVRGRDSSGWPVSGAVTPEEKEARRQRLRALAEHVEATQRVYVASAETFGTVILRDAGGIATAHDNMCNARDAWHRALAALAHERE